MFHNEFAALDIKLAEARHWVDEVHMCESSRTFQNATRAPVLQPGDPLLPADPRLHCHLFDGAGRFHPAFKWGPSRYFPFFRKKKMARHNETMQRNYVHEVFADIADDDIIILSDSDEILDSRRADELVEAVRKYGLVSVELHHTLFYLNLYSLNWHEVWPGSPPNYAYRAFILTGHHFRKLREGSDRLRRRGEWGRLAKEIPLLKGFHGYHHSWLGDAAAAAAKLQSYAHSLDEHRIGLTDSDGSLSLAKLGELIRSGESLFEGHRLDVRDFSVTQPLRGISDNHTKYRDLILESG